MSFRAKFKQSLWREQDHLCGICKKMIMPSELLDTDRVNVDHIRPKCRGGRDVRSNLQITHVPCNSAKAGKWCESDREMSSPADDLLAAMG